MFCTHCGKELLPNACFCSSCGARVAAGCAADSKSVEEAKPEVVQGESMCKEEPCRAAYGETILDYIRGNPPGTRNVAVGDAITSRLLADYRLGPDERPYAVVNKRNVFFNLRNYGLVITNRGIHYRALKGGSDFEILFMKAKVGFVDWYEMHHFQVGDYDGFRSYVGHTFEINHESVGLVRMGTGVCCDDRVTSFLNGLSTAMVEAGLLKDLPTEYDCQ